MKRRVIEAIEKFVENYQQNENISTRWGVPLVGFAAGNDRLFKELRTVIGPTHALPEDILADARTVIAFFLPFPKTVTRSNIKERKSSTEWAVSYVETNILIQQLSLHLQQFFEQEGECSVSIPATHNWIEDKLISDWSHRHVAYIAGLGTFGLNNMLITDNGCCGRVGSFVTSAAIEPDSRPEYEACLYKHDGSCKKCTQKCVNEALYEGAFDRFKCYEMLLENVEEHKSVGYADVCGKCLVAVPCSHSNPVKLKIRSEVTGHQQIF
jgi:epoxyqueuosine reductase QueG